MRYLQMQIFMYTSHLVYQNIKEHTNMEGMRIQYFRVFLLCCNRLYVRWTARAITPVLAVRDGRVTVPTATLGLSVETRNTVTSTPPAGLIRPTSRSGTE
jgi:hypothetical protein